MSAGRAPDQCPLHRRAADIGRHLGQEETGSDCIHLDAVLREFDRVHLGQPNDRVFRRGVCNLQAFAGCSQPVHRRNIDDLPPALFLHQASRMLGTQKRAGYVDRHDMIPGRSIELHHRFLVYRAGIVDQDVEPAIAPGNAGNRFFNRLLVADVQLKRRTVRTQLLQYLCVAIGTPCPDRHFRSGVTQRQRQLAPDAAVGTGDQRNLSFE